MSQSLETIRRARLHHAQQALEGLSTHIADLERAHANAVEAFEAARAVMDDLANGLDEARARHGHAASSVDQLLGVMRRDVVRKLPVDVLVQIFNAAMGASVTRTQDEYGDVRDDLGDAMKVAFILAAVCARWRSAALNYAPLWSCIELEYAEGAAPRASHIEHVHLLLQRSRASSIHVRLDWSTYHEWYTCDIAKAVLDALCLQAARWRTFEFRVPNAQDLKDGLRVLKGPLPQLQCLTVIAHDLDTQPTSTESGYLPSVPNLGILVLLGPHGFIPLPPGRWGSLRALRILFPLSFELTWNLLNAAAATVESLVLFSAAAPSPTANLPLLELPNLTALNLVIEPTFDHFVDVLRLPRLELLGTYVELISQPWQPFLERVAPTVTRLNLRGQIGCHVLRLAKCLTRLQRLSISAGDAGDSIPGEFCADKQMWVDEALWPALSSVNLAEGSRDLNRTGNMLPFIRWRTEQLREEHPEDSRPTRLKEFILEDPDAPQWLRCEIDRLIAAGAAAESAAVDSELQYARHVESAEYIGILVSRPLPECTCQTRWST